MSKIVIRKRVDLDFLGDEYNEAYLVFRSIPVGEYDGILEQIHGVDDGQDSKANGIILKLLKSQYLEGKFPGEDGKLEDLDSVDELDGLDKDGLLECFGKLIGQDIRGAVDRKTNGEVTLNPKSETPSTPGSTAENPPQ